uniref:NUC153 domain-containing protein n=1 Tax=Caenorhabditis tropicalis TaxID=1561998 RepID=A0A1I7TDG9_9PELO
MENEDKEEDRRQRSDEARRAAMRQKIQQKKDRDRQIAIDIANVDQKATKRIVFDDSDDNDEVEKITENGKKKSSVNGSKRPKLFDSEGEDEDENGSEIEIKNRHSGPKGEQLMKLESRFNRCGEKEMKMEKDKNRELLSKILGKSIEEKKPKSAEATALKARPFTRFDPENPEHLAWMKEFEASKNPQKRMNESKNEDSEDEEKDDENTEEVGKEKGEKEEKEENSDNDNYEKAEMYFKMDDKFSAEMKGRNDSGETSNAGFSFLSMIGRNYENGPKEEDEDEKEKPVEFNKKKKLEWKM